VIQSVDSLDLMRRLDEAAVQLGTRPEILVQVDLAGEATKHGAPPDEARKIVDTALACRAVRLKGLMLLPPWLEDPEQVRPYFARLREFRDGLVAGGADAGALAELSMGMSHDFEVAIQEGATMVRVGTAIFGRRASHV
jgi:pyridoxal phosphate enzyme (YggS family)